MELKTLTLNGTTYDSFPFKLTDADKQEIAELTAPLVNVPEGGGGSSGGSSGWEVLMDTTLEQETEIIIKNLTDVTEAFVNLIVPPYPDGAEQTFTSSGNILGVHLNGMPVRRKEKAVVIASHAWSTGKYAHGWVYGGTSSYGNNADFDDTLATSLNGWKASGKTKSISQINLNWDIPPGTYVYIAVRR